MEAGSQPGHLVAEMENGDPAVFLSEGSVGQSGDEEGQVFDVPEPGKGC